MKTGFYPKLALTGIQKNKRLYTPFILTCIGMVAMNYIISFLASSELLNHIDGGSTMKSMLGFGSWVMAVFSVIFLFYTNSFLIRRRKKEFGLYNILGMGKRNIGRIMVWETVMITGLSLFIGLGSGIAFSKLAELGLVNTMKGDVVYTFSISVEAILQTAVVFCAIFIVILVNSLRQVHISNPIALLNSESSGERPPKANWFLGIIGVVLLGAAYSVAVSINQPLSALVWFFIAVIAVILATYILFIAGSVLLCRLLQKKKSYYYKPNHFVSVSSMAYRMKRNGAGLASICILSTMVLVIISSSACLYFGTEDSLHARYPRDIAADIDFKKLEYMNDTNIGTLRSEIEKISSQNNANPVSILDYRYAVIAGLLADGVLETDSTAFHSFSTSTYDNVYQVYFIPLSDYNRMMGTSETLYDNEAMIYAFRSSYTEDSLTINKSTTFEIKKTLDNFFDNSLATMDVVPSLFVVVPELEASVSNLLSLIDSDGKRMLSLSWYYGYDSSTEPEVQISIKDQIRSRLRDLEIENTNGIYCSFVESLAANRGDFYGSYGGIFFLGILLSIVFIFATVLIIYYKQISEGYEDQSRFAIMQKVGMTKQDIRKNINSQILTVFFLPLVTAVLHLSFAFPMIRKLLILFNLTNLKLLLTTTSISILIFALLYAMVYRITSNAYYSIVSNVDKA